MHVIFPSGQQRVSVHRNYVLELRFRNDRTGGRTFKEQRQDESFSPALSVRYLRRFNVTSANVTRFTFLRLIDSITSFSFSLYIGDCRIGWTIYYRPYFILKFYLKNFLKNLMVIIVLWWFFYIYCQGHRELQRLYSAVVVH